MILGERRFKGIHTRLIAREMEISLERVSEGLEERPGYLIVGGRDKGGHGRSLEWENSERREGRHHPVRLFIQPYSCYRPPP